MQKKLIYKIFGLKLRDARKKSGLTQVDLADRVGLSRTSITNIEKGRQGIPLHMLLQLASAVGVQPVGLLPETKNSPEQDLIDRNILKKSIMEEEGVGWAERVISSGMKMEVNDERN
ncbi:MAG: helix-turn-helix domain-containing protein [Deltaproteobacteria bacterium]|nr:helix-turn-helix domain-containing protein [Deltaproteobacteria bacterium]